jgi:multiple sugar transport system permease protein
MVGTRSFLTARVALYALGLVGAVLMLTPFLYMAGTAFKPHAFVLELPPSFIPREPTLDNFIRAWTSNNFQRYFMNSVLVATSATAITVVFSAMLAFAFARYEFPGKNVLFYGMLATLMIPSMVLIIPQFVLAKNLHLLNSLLGLVVVYSAGSAINVFLLRGFFEEIPRDLDDAGRIDGCNMLTLFLYVMLPLAKPALATVAIFSFLGAWDEFSWAVTAISDEALYTLPVAIRMFQRAHGTEWGLVFAASLIAVVPVIAVFVIFQRQFVKGVMAGAVKG